MFFIFPIPINWFRKKKKTKPTKVPSNKILHYNCARVYVGNYTRGHIAFFASDDTYENLDCGFTVESGEIVKKRLRSLKIKGATDSLNDSPLPKPFTVLRTYILYPKTETAMISVTNGKRVFRIRLIKSHSKRSTMFKLRL